MDIANVTTTGQVTAVMNTPVNATITVMAVMDPLTVTVKFALKMLASTATETVSVTHTGPENHAPSGEDCATQSVMAVLDQTKVIVGTVPTTLSVTARRLIMMASNSRLTVAVAANQTGATLLTVAYTTELVIPTA
jgi:hypothetical protein